MIRHRQVTAGDVSIHVAEAGPGQGPAYLFVHGWPESWRTWQDLMVLAGRTSRVLAIDLPGIGGSQPDTTNGSKLAIARLLRHLVQALDLADADLTLVGHDIGGMVVYAYLRAFAGLPHAVIMDVPVPGVDPWDDFVRQPFLWHFALHAVPGLPELLTEGRHEAYFRYFYDLLSAHPGAPAATPLLYLRGSRERGGEPGPYADGFRRAGVTHVESALIEGAGHFPQEEATAPTWAAISSFASGRQP